MTVLRIATRSSPLALWQANHVAALLSGKTGIVSKLVHVTTQGDRNRVDPLASFGGTGLFTREVQRAVLENEADLAVHSLKDLPTVPSQGLTLGAVPARAPRFDVLVLPRPTHQASDTALTVIANLPTNARVGTGSPRRQALLRRLRTDLRAEEVRGNVETRLHKLDSGEYDAIVLAEAGLIRLGLADRISARLLPPQFYPAVGQGALGLECRADDQVTRDLLLTIEDHAARTEVTAERAALATLQAGCHAPVGTYAQLEGNALQLEVVVVNLTTGEQFYAVSEGHAETATEIGRLAAEQLLKTGARDLI